MGCHRIKGSEAWVYYCMPNIYKYTYNNKDYYFEWHNYLGPCPVRKKDLEPWERGTPKGFYDMLDEWTTLSLEQQQEYLIYG